MRADGQALYDGNGNVVALAGTAALAARIADCVNDVDEISGDLEELLIACGLDYARSWAPHEAFAEVTRQIRMVRKTFPNARASLST